MVSSLRSLAIGLSVSLALVACASRETPQPIALARVPAAGCLAWTGQPIGRVCVPREAREGARLAFEIESSLGSCGAHVDRCTASVDGRDVTLSIDGRSCPAEETCADLLPRRVVCTIPPLAQGRYSVRWGDASGRVDTLDVVAGEAQSTCTFDGSRARPLKASWR